MNLLSKGFVHPSWFLKACDGSVQMMHTLLPRGLLLHADAPRTFSEQLLTLGTLPLMKVNADAAATAKRLEVRADSQCVSSPARHVSQGDGLRSNAQCAQALQTRRSPKAEHLTAAA